MDSYACDQKQCNEVQTCFYFEYSFQKKKLFFLCGFWRFFKENPAVVVTVLSLIPTSPCHCRCPGGALCPSELVSQSFLLAQDIFHQGKAKQSFLFIWLSCSLCGSAQSAGGAQASSAPPPCTLSPLQASPEVPGSLGKHRWATSKQCHTNNLTRKEQSVYFSLPQQVMKINRPYKSID